MTRDTLEEGLSVYRCSETGGVFIPVDSYWRWLQKQPGRLAHLPAPVEESPKSEESTRILVCPESGMLMIRCRVGHGFDFSIDRSPHGSIWLDSGEWEALRAPQFHDELHLVFTAPWQRGVRKAGLAEAERSRFHDRFGEEMLDRLDRLKEDLADHPDREMALAYLLRRD